MLTCCGLIASIIEVSLAPACASPCSIRGHHEATLRCSLVSVRIAEATASAFPPWPFTNTTPSHQSADRTISIKTSENALVPIDNVPGKPACSPLAEIVRLGAIRIRSSCFAACAHKYCAICVSVSSGKCGPCCSHDPSGNNNTIDSRFATCDQVLVAMLLATPKTKRECVCAQSALLQSALLRLMHHRMQPEMLWCGHPGRSCHR